jgi:hypothetical protein
MDNFSDPSNLMIVFDNLDKILAGPKRSGEDKEEEQEVDQLEDDENLDENLDAKDKKSSTNTKKILKQILTKTPQFSNLYYSIRYAVSVLGFQERIRVIFPILGYSESSTAEKSNNGNTEIKKQNSPQNNIQQILDQSQTLYQQLIKLKQFFQTQNPDSDGYKRYVDN